MNVKSVKIHPVGDELFLTNGDTSRQTGRHTTKVTGACRKFVKAPIVICIRYSCTYRVLHDLWTLLQEVISWVFVIKNFIKTRVRFWTVTELWAFFNSRTRPPVNRVLRNQRRVMYSAWLLIVFGSCNEQLAQFTTERQPVLRPAVAFSKTSLNTDQFKLKVISRS